MKWPKEQKWNDGKLRWPMKRKHIDDASKWQITSHVIFSAQNPSILEVMFMFECSLVFILRLPVIYWCFFFKFFKHNEMLEISLNDFNIWWPAKTRSLLKQNKTRNRWVSATPNSLLYCFSWLLITARARAKGNIMEDGNRKGNKNWKKKNIFCQCHIQHLKLLLASSC